MQIVTSTAQSVPATATRWYRVVVGGDETIYTSAGEELGQKFVIEGFNLELSNRGFFGFGTRDAIQQAAADKCPDKRLIDFWPLSSAPAEEF